MGILGTVTQLQEVDLGQTPSITGFPAVTVYLTGVQEQLEDNRPSFYRTFTFTIEVVQELKNKSRSAGEQDFEDAVEGVLNAFKANPFLLWGGVKNADDAEMSNGHMVLGDFYFGVGCMMSLTLTVKTLVY